MHCMFSLALQCFLFLSCVRLLLLVYLLYIGTFTLCCVFRPLKDIPENYTHSDQDKTIRIQKRLNVCWSYGTNVISQCYYIKLSFIQAHADVDIIYIYSSTVIECTGIAALLRSTFYLTTFI